MVALVAERVHGHDGVHHRRVDGPQAIAELQTVEHPVLCFPQRAPADLLDALALPALEQGVGLDEDVADPVPAMERELAVGVHQFIDPNPPRRRPGLADGLDDGKGDDDGSGPRGHLVQEVAREDQDLGRDRGTVFPGEEVEEAVVDLGVAVAGLDPPHLEDEFASPLHARVVGRHPRHLEHAVGAHGGVDLRRPGFVGVPAAVRALGVQDGAHGLADPGHRGRVPGAVRIGRVEPHLQEDVVRLQSGVGRQIPHPIPFLVLFGCEGPGRPDGGLPDLMGGSARGGPGGGRCFFNDDIRIGYDSQRFAHTCTPFRGHLVFPLFIKTVILLQVLEKQALKQPSAGVPPGSARTILPAMYIKGS